MLTRVYKMFATAAAASNAAAQLTLQGNGRITAVLLGMSMNSVTDNDEASFELSFGNYSQVQSNDAIGPFAQMGLTSNFVTSGMDKSGKELFIGGIAIPVRVGNIVYLNIGGVTGTPTVDCFAFIYVAEGRR